MPVRAEPGTIGYLWASDPENAASFEPRDVGDDAIYRAGLVWLERLRSAHDQGLSPSAALAELAAMPDEGSAGHVESDARSQRIDLAALRGLAAGNRSTSSVTGRATCPPCVFCSAVFDDNSFEVTLDECTKVEGASGSVFGPAVILDEGASRVLSGAKLQKWITERGADIRVVTQKLIYPIPPRVRAQHLQ